MASSKKGKIYFFDIFGTLLNVLNIECPPSDINFNWNPNIKNLLAIQILNRVEILQLKSNECTFTLLEVHLDIDQFLWRNYNEFVTINTDGKMVYKRIGLNENLIEYNISEGKIKKVSFNNFRTLLASLNENCSFVNIWTIERETHLIQINEDEIIQDLIWYSEDSYIRGNYLGLLTKMAFKLWDIELGKVKMNICLNCNPIKVSLIGSKLAELYFIIENDEEKPLIISAKSNSSAVNSYEGNLSL